MGWKVLRKHGASCVCSLPWLHGNVAAATKRKNLHCVASAFRRAQPGSPAGGRVQHPPVSISHAPVWLCRAHCPDRHGQLPFSFYHVRGVVGTRCLFIPKDHGPQGQVWPGRSLGSRAEAAGVALPAAGTPLPASSLCFSGAKPACPHPRAGAGSDLVRGASPASPPRAHLCWELLGKILEHQGDRSLLSSGYQDSPAESGWRNVAAGQAAPHGAGGDAAAAGAGLPGSPGTHIPVGGCWGRCLGMAGLA